MSDYERYGDYNETEDEKGGSSHLVLRLLKLLVVLLLVSVCALIAFRLIVAEYYPRAMKNVYMTDALKAYSLENELNMEKRDVAVEFDDRSEGSFHAENLWIDEAAGALQLSVRMNDATMEFLAERKGLSEIPSYSDSLFVFYLTDNEGRRYSVSYAAHDSYLWYETVKLCFDGVVFEEDLAWMRLEVFETTGGAPDPAQDPYACVLLCAWKVETVS